MNEEDFLGMDAFEIDGFPAFDDTELPDDFISDPEPQGEDDNDIEKDTVENEGSESVDSGNDGSDEGSNDGDDDGDSSSNLYSSLAKVIHEQGLLPSLNPEDDKIETIDDFVNAFKRESEIIAQTKLDEYIANLDIDKIADNKTLLDNVAGIDEQVLRQDIDLAKSIIKQDYLNQGFDENRVNRLLNRLTDLGEDAILEDATESLESVKRHAQKQIDDERAAYDKRMADQAKEQAELDAKIKKTVFEQDLIQGLKPTKVMRDTVYKNMTEIVGKSPDGTLENAFLRDRRENPLEFETRMYYMYTLTNGFKDFSKLTNTSKSSAVSELERAFRTNKPIDNSTPVWMQDNDSYSGDFTLNI